MIRNHFLAVLLLTGLWACHDDVLITQQWHWETKTWVHGDVKELTLEATDTTTRYAMDLDLAWDKKYAFQNLYIRTRTTFPSGKEVTSVTSLEMTDDDGSWAGDCNGSTCHLSFPLQKVFTFPEVGTYAWQVEPYMRVDTVRGVKNLRVTCRKLQ